jgi:(aminoalkyl)phosphonate N-acetyltransferase
MAASNPVVRKARIEDCKRIYNIICDLEERIFEYSVFESLYKRNLDNPENIYLVTEEGRAISGYVSCHGQFLLHHGGRVFEIQELYVGPEFRSKGIGRLLLQNLEVALSQFDYKSLEVTANKRREKTHDFYTKMGFQFTHFKFTKEKS